MENRHNNRIGFLYFRITILFRRHYRSHRLICFVAQVFCRNRDGVKKTSASNRRT